jgi:hypothetical protein
MKIIPKTLQPQAGDVLLVSCPHYWGKAPTIKEAIKNMRDAGGRTTGPWRVYSVHPSTTIMDTGYIVHDQDGHPPVMLAEYDPH